MSLDTHKDAVARVLAEACVNGELPRRAASLSLEECEWARQAIEVLNEHSLADLVQQVPPEPGFRMVEAVRNAIGLAAKQDSLLYCLGPHPALVLSAIEAICGFESTEDGATLTHELAVLADRTAMEYRLSCFGMLWRTVGAACRRPLRLASRSDVDPAVVAENHFYRSKALQHPDAPVLSRFLERTGTEVNEPAESRSGLGLGFGEVIVVVQQQSELSVEVAYGSKRIIREAAKYIQRTGIPLAVTGISKNSLGVIEGLLYFGYEEEEMVPTGVREFGAVEAVICVSRGDVAPVAKARRVLIYQHGPHPMEGLYASYAFLNRFNLRVTCLSESSAREQVSYGLRPELVSFVYSAYNKRILSGADGPRDEHAMMFAGGVIDYKGTDIAIAAFRILKVEFQDASFHIYGNNGGDWSKSDSTLLQSEWLDPDGHIDFEAVAEAIPGVVFHDEAGLEDLAVAYRAHSLLVMPSRVAETFGLVSIEAQACGCMPVLPRNGAFPETMEEGVTGHLYDDNTPEGLAGAVAELWRHGKPTDEERKAAMESVDRRFDWDKTGSEVLGLLTGTPRKSAIGRGVMFLNWYVCLLWYYHGSVGALLKAVGRKMKGVLVVRAR